MGLVCDLCVVEKRQEELREAYHIKDKDVVVIEKRHLPEVILRVSGTIIRILVIIAIFILAAVNATALVCPESRKTVLMYCVICSSTIDSSILTDFLFQLFKNWSNKKRRNTDLQAIAKLLYRIISTIYDVPNS